jgi:DNA-binding PadR family transcriptional regulator
MRSVTQYELKRALEQKVSPFFSASLGSIQAALKKLLRNGHIEVFETVENGRNKKIFSITSTGKTYFLQWMMALSPPSRIESESITKVFFMGLVSASDRMVIVRQIISELENIVREYEDKQAEYSEKVFPEKVRNIVKYQMKTLDLGIIQQVQTLAWFRKIEKGIMVEIRG